MTAAMAMPGNTAETFLGRFFGTGLADDRYVVERFRARGGPDREWRTDDRMHRITGTADVVDIDAIPRHERDKCCLPNLGGARPVRVPIALIEDRGDGVVSMPEWLALEKGMI